MLKMATGAGMEARQLLDDQKESVFWKRFYSRFKFHPLDRPILRAHLKTHYQEGELMTVIESNDITGTARTYHFKKWVLALNLFSLLFIILIMGMSLTMMILPFSRAMGNAETDQISYWLFLVLSPLFVVLGLLLLLLVVVQFITVIGTFMARLKTSPTGLEVHYWPYMQYRCIWSDIERLGSLLFARGIYIRQFEITGFSISFVWPFNLFRSKPTFMELSNYEGWKDGQLARDFRQYAPHLFEGLPPAAESAEDLARYQAPVQNERTWAGLAHLSFFTPVGVFAPAAIWLVFRDKSPYVRFQAAQATIWQLIILIFTLILTVFSLGLFFVPILGGPSEDLAMAAQTLLLPLGVVLSLFLVQIICSIYSIAGAILAFMGKDFRYAVIGSLLKKQDIGD